MCLSFTSSGEWCILVLLRASRSKWRASRTGEKILSLDDCNKTSDGKNTKTRSIMVKYNKRVKKSFYTHDRDRNS